MAAKLNLCTLFDEQYGDINEMYPKLQKYCYFLSQSKWDGDDLAQEAMIKAITYYHKDKITSTLLNKIARNLWIDTIRKRTREELRENLMGEESYSWNGDILDAVDLLMHHFTPKQAIIYFLKEAFQYRSKEIAEILATTEMAVKSSLIRSRKRAENQREMEELNSSWEDEESKLLGKLFQDSLASQDPTILIEAIQSINDSEKAPSAVSRINIPVKGSTPLSTLTMAA